MCGFKCWAQRSRWLLCEHQPFHLAFGRIPNLSRHHPNLMMTFCGGAVLGHGHPQLIQIGCFRCLTAIAMAIKYYKHGEPMCYVTFDLTLSPWLIRFFQLPKMILKDLKDCIYTRRFCDFKDQVQMGDVKPLWSQAMENPLIEQTPGALLSFFQVGLTKWGNWGKECMKMRTKKS